MLSCGKSCEKVQKNCGKDCVKSCGKIVGKFSKNALLEKMVEIYTVFPKDLHGALLEKIIVLTELMVRFPCFTHRLLLLLI